MKKIVLYTFLLIALFCFSLAQAQSKISLTNLQCEMLSNPEGIDVVQPRLSWQIKSDVNEVEQTIYHILVASTKEKLDANDADLWDSGKVNSNQSINVIYKGQKLTSRKEAYWKVKVWTNKGETSWSAVNYWSIGILTYVDWKTKLWIGYDFPFEWDSITTHARLSARYFRKEFQLKNNIKKAKVYIMGLGLYELYINGDKIGNQVLAPVPTDYAKNVKYNVFDVTNKLKEGNNALGTILGNGRYFTMRQDYKANKIKTFGYPKMAMRLEVEYADGTKEVVTTDETWKLTANGPILTNNEYDGEEYDARKEMPNWNKIGFDDSKWIPATYVQEPGGFYEAQMTPGMKIMQEVKPISLQKSKSGTYIVDMGQNIAGWLQIKVRGNRGDKITMKFAESLQKDGSLYIANLRDANTTDVYILKGDAEETWEPRFVFHGFRFVEISGLSRTPILDDFVGKVVYDDIHTTGTFECSDTTMNQIFKNAHWGIKDNYKGMPIDCPQRNERQPWLGDRTTGAYGESFLFNNQTLYAKWLDDIKNAQTRDGGIPDVAPAFWRYYGDNVTWPGTYITVADMLYRQFDDKKVIEKYYPSMKKWIVYMEENYMENDLIAKDKYGDWCVPPESLELIHSLDPSRKTDGELISSAFYYYLLQKMKNFAEVIHADANDIQYYDLLSQKIKTAFNAKFFNATTHTYSNNTVTANVLPLAIGLVPENAKQQVFDNMVHVIEVTNNGHISTGVIGTQFLMRTLSNFGRADLALQLASNKSYPSWGYMVENGATTIWELWNGNTADPKMNSQNHVMLLGDLLIWYYENIAGIKSNPEMPGFKQIIMKPAFDTKLTYVNASYESVHGVIKSNWKKEKKGMLWNITIPANTSALVYLPTQNIKNIVVNKVKLEKTEFFQSNEGNQKILSLPSGEYSINWN